MANGTFACCINCMDGRTQLPVNKWMSGEFGVDFIDTVTEPGPVKILADGAPLALLDSIRKRVEISVLKHGANSIVVVAHHDCAGNPVGDEVQLKEMELALARVRAFGLGVNVSGVWVDETWKVNTLE